MYFSSFIFIFFYSLLTTIPGKEQNHYFYVNLHKHNFTLYTTVKEIEQRVLWQFSFFSLSLSNRNIQMVNVRFVKSFRFACRSINCNAPHDLNGSFPYFKSSLSLYIFGYWSSPTYFSRIPFSFFVGIFCSFRLVELDKLQSFWSEEAMVSMAREREYRWEYLWLTSHYFERDIFYVQF